MNKGDAEHILIAPEFKILISLIETFKLQSCKTQQLKKNVCGHNAVLIY